VVCSVRDRRAWGAAAPKPAQKTTLTAVARTENHVFKQSGTLTSRHPHVQQPPPQPEAMPNREITKHRLEGANCENHGDPERICVFRRQVKYLKADENRSLRQGPERREYVVVLFNVRNRCAATHAGAGGHAQGRACCCSLSLAACVDV